MEGKRHRKRTRLCNFDRGDFKGHLWDNAPSKYKKLKGLIRKNQNLRDHMTDLELIFTMLGERVTTEISQKEKPETFIKKKKVAKRGGGVAGTALRETEKELGRSVVSSDNFLPPARKIKTKKISC